MDTRNYQSHRAPGREEIAHIHDPAELAAIIEHAEETEIAVKTQLETLALGEYDRHRRVDALGYWRIAKHHAEKRLKSLERRGAAVAS